MPMAWFTLFFMIFAGFFQYDRCIAEQDGKRALLRASEMRDEDEAAVIRKVMGNGELAGKKKLLFSEGIRRELRVKKDKAEIKTGGRIRTILNCFVKEGVFSVFSYAGEYEVKKYDPVHFIRICRRIENYGGD